MPPLNRVPSFRYSAMATLLRRAGFPMKLRLASCRRLHPQPQQRQHQMADIADWVGLATLIKVCLILRKMILLRTKEENGIGISVSDILQSIQILIKY
jgi:hypothetical protein